MIKKNANERYQSASGLAYDIEKAKDLLQVTVSQPKLVPSLSSRISHAQYPSKGTETKRNFPCSPLENTEANGESQMYILKLFQSQLPESPEYDGLFVLGEQDRMSSLRGVYEMLGRETELQTILDTYQLAQETSRPATVLIGGYSGIGKRYDFCTFLSKQTTCYMEQNANKTGFLLPL